MRIRQSAAKKKADEAIKQELAAALKKVQNGIRSSGQRTPAMERKLSAARMTLRELSDTVATADIDSVVERTLPLLNDLMESNGITPGQREHLWRAISDIANSRPP